MPCAARHVCRVRVPRSPAAQLGNVVLQYLIKHRIGVVFPVVQYERADGRPAAQLGNVVFFLYLAEGMADVCGRGSLLLA